MWSNKLQIEASIKIVNFYSNFLFCCDSISLLTAKNPTVSSGFFGGERELRLSARTGEFTRIVERATESSTAQPSCAIE